MDRTTALVAAGGLAMATGVWGIAQLILAATRPEQRRVRERLGGESARKSTQAQSPILKKHLAEQDRPAIVNSSSFLRQLETRLQLVSPNSSIGGLLGLSLLIALVCGAIVFYFMQSPLLAGGAGLAGAAIPVIALNRKWAKRQRLIGDQLIEALDFLARVLRAGHSFSTGLQMVGDELPEPIAHEFRKCYGQHDLGQPIEVALSEMAARISLTPFNFFVSSVVIQRQTGGDLAEILDNISKTIRSRIRLEQHMRALTSEGRATGLILTALPAVIFLAMYVMNRDYASTLLTTELGRMMLLGVVVLLGVGQWMIKKIMDIKV